MTLRTLLRAGLFALLAFVTFETLTPDPDDTKTEMGVAQLIALFLFGGPALADKVAHFTAYFSLAIAAGVARLAPAGRDWLLAVALGAYGALLEVLQGLGGVRDAEWRDGFANALGAVTGVAIFAAASRVVRHISDLRRNAKEAHGS